MYESSHRPVPNCTLSHARTRPRVRWVAAASLSILWCVALSSSPSSAASLGGRLDPSFGSGGKVTNDFSGSGSFDFARSAAIQGNGRIVVAGYSDASGSDDFALARYMPNGALDSTFNSTGTVLTDFSGSGSSDLGAAVAIQPDGKIVMAGPSAAGGSFDFALARYTPQGALDASFNSTGMVTTDFGGSGQDVAYAMAIQADGRIVVAGYSNASGSVDFALARYTPSGALDTTFNSTGMVTTDFGGSGGEDVAYAVAIQSDGKIVAAGGSGPAADDFALARFTPNGALDTSFNSVGTVLTDFNGLGSYDQALGAAIQPDGKIVAGGITFANGDSSDFALARYTPNGVLDTSFNSVGTVITDFNCSGSYDQANAVAIQGDGKIVASGTCVANLGGDFALARYKPNGALDTSFNTTGTVTTDFSGVGSDEGALALVIQRDGKLVAAGPSNAVGSYDFALARYKG
jgi:uncharacterized delta-60 repeat protein